MLRETLFWQTHLNVYWWGRAKKLFFSGGKKSIKSGLQAKITSAYLAAFNAVLRLNLSFFSAVAAARIAVYLSAGTCLIC